MASLLRVNKHFIIIPIDFHKTLSPHLLHWKWVEFQLVASALTSAYCLLSYFAASFSHLTNLKAPQKPFGILRGLVGSQQEPTASATDGAQVPMLICVLDLHMNSHHEACEDADGVGDGDGDGDGYGCAEQDAAG